MSANIDGGSKFSLTGTGEQSPEDTVQPGLFLENGKIPDLRYFGGFLCFS